MSAALECTTITCVCCAGVPEKKIRCVEHETDAPAELELDGTDKVFILHDLTTPQLTKQVRDGILARLEEKEAQA